jgi:hypothetical protein
MKVQAPHNIHLVAVISLICFSTGAEGSAIYFTDGRDIKRANLDGTGLEVIYTDDRDKWSVDLDIERGHVYWSGPGSIRRANLDGSNVETLVTPDEVGLPGLAPQGLSLDLQNSKLYWAALLSQGHLGRANLDGTNAELLTASDNPRMVAIDSSASRMYWTDDNGLTPGIYRANLDGSGKQRIVSNTFSPIGITFDQVGDYIYWTDDDVDAVRRLDLNTSRTVTVAQVRPPNEVPADLTGIAVDRVNGHLYWGQGDTFAKSNTIWRANLDGTSATPFLTGFKNVVDIALDVRRPPLPIPGDYNGDNTVRQADLNLVLASWGRDGATPPPGWTTHFPAGLIDQGELDGVVLNWSSTSGPLDLTMGTSNGALSARYDLKTNAAIIDFNSSSPVATVRQQIIAGRGGAGLGKPWNGDGITSSAAAAANAAEPESRSIGYAENSALPLGPYVTFHGRQVDASSLLIAFTRTGDANLDGIVNDDDVTIVSATYAPGVPQPHWALGDFDYNGFVDDDDVTLLSAFYDPAAAPIAEFRTSEFAAIPEPGASLLIASGFVVVAWLTIRRCLLSRSESAT